MPCHSRAALVLESPESKDNSFRWRGSSTGLLFSVRIAAQTHKTSAKCSHRPPGGALKSGKGNGLARDCAEAASGSIRAELRRPRASDDAAASRHRSRAVSLLLRCALHDG